MQAFLNGSKGNSGGGGETLPQYISGMVAHYSDISGNANITRIIPSPTFSLSSSGLTIELHYRADSARDGNSFCGLQFGTSTPYIVVNFYKGNSYDGENADYHLDPFIQYGSSYTQDDVSIDNLKWGTKHTYTFILKNNTLGTYFDGVDTGLSSTYSNYTFNGDKIYIFDRDSIDRRVNGNWYDVRIYNRALSAEEIAHNYQVDIALYS